MSDTAKTDSLQLDRLCARLDQCADELSVARIDLYHLRRLAGFVVDAYRTDIVHEPPMLKSAVQALADELQRGTKDGRS
jgi:hypothetical protein